MPVALPKEREKLRLLTMILALVIGVLLIAALLFYRRIEDVPPSRDTGEPDTQT